MNNTCRIPKKKATLAATKGAVIIITGKGENVVITPDLARSIASQLPGMATLAERDLTEVAPVDLSAGFIPEKTGYIQ